GRGVRGQERGGLLPYPRGELHQAVARRVGVGQELHLRPRGREGLGGGHDLDPVCVTEVTNDLRIGLADPTREGRIELEGDPRELDRIASARRDARTGAADREEQTGEPHRASSPLRSPRASPESSNGESRAKGTPLVAVRARAEAKAVQKCW